MECWKVPIPTNLCDKYCLGNKFAAAVLRELLCRARNQDGVYYTNKGYANLKRGQCVCGRKELCKCFGLKPNEDKRVRNILDFLEKTAKQIAKQKTRNGTIITILYYDEIIEMAKQKANQGPNKGQSKATNKSVKSVKNENKELIDYLSSKINNGFEKYEDKIIEFFKYRMAKPKDKQYKSGKGIDGLFRDLSGCRDNSLDLIKCLDITMERNWLTPDLKYFTDGSAKKSAAPDQEQPQKALETSDIEGIVY